MNEEGQPFSTLINAITNDTELRQDEGFNENRKPNETTKAALRQFRKDFMPGLFTTDHHFNLNDLLKALDLYEQYLDTWNWNQNSLFWCQVIGYLQRLVPAVIAQAFCRGLHKQEEHYSLEQPFKRSLELYTWDRKLISYFVDEDQSKLGFDFGIGVGLSNVSQLVGFGRHGALIGLESLKNYVGQTQQSLADLCSSWNSPNDNLRCSQTQPSKQYVIL